MWYQLEQNLMKGPEISGDARTKIATELMQGRKMLRLLICKK